MAPISSIFVVAVILGTVLSVVQSSDPVPLCNEVTICIGSTLTAAALDKHSYDPNGGVVYVSISPIGPWSNQGIEIVTLTVTNDQGSSASIQCPVAVVDCLKYQQVQPLTTAFSATKSDATLLTRSNKGEVISLTKVSTDGQEIQPVGRSYDGNDWEAYAGDFASLKFDCNVGNNSMCQVVLPPPEQGYLYNLTTFTYPNASPIDDAARFLEQTTFGPTLRELHDIKLVGYAGWIQNQQSLPLTSHRAFFRTRAAHKYDFPSPMGLVTQACRKGTHYRRYAFSSKDRGRTVDITKSTTSGKYILSINGQARTVVDKIEGQFPNGKILLYGIGSYRICAVVEDELGGQFLMSLPNLGCPSIQLFNGVPGNPSVQFSATDLPTNELIRLAGFVRMLDGQLYGGVPQDLVLDEDVTDNQCDTIPDVTGVPEHAVVGMTKNTAGRVLYWLHSPVFDLQENTLEAPLPDGGGYSQSLTDDSETDSKFQVLCSNVPRTFLNEDTCVVSTDQNACSPRDSTPDVVLQLNSTTLQKIYTYTRHSAAGAVYLYAVTGLKQAVNETDPPCLPGARSRWIPVADCRVNATTDTIVSDRTKLIFQRAIQRSSDVGNTYLRDVYSPITGATCAPTDLYAFNFKVLVDGICWQNVHPDYYQVYDFTTWVTNHPGNAAFPSNANPIAAFENKNNILQFPSNTHPMERWYSNKQRFSVLGRLGDSINFKDLPRPLIRDDIASAFGATDAMATAGASTAVITCGSPFEVANDKLNYGNRLNGTFDLATTYYKSTLSWDFVPQRTTVWMNIALFAQDQLRQRVAWALSQVLVVSPGSILTKDVSENFLNYYDIFVRNAFGNYRDVLKEVSYSPMMAEMLSYLDSTSTAYQWTQFKQKQYADENYAREVMQLFSIGLFMMNSDGTAMLQGNTSVPTYTNDEITEYARVWTGFSQQNARGNIEDDMSDGFASNQIDPMQINIDWRDPFPKLGLNKQYVGDAWPLCADLPKQHFLKAGATFRFLGTNPRPQLQSDPMTWQGSAPKRFTLDPNSFLYKTLCNAATAGGRCRYSTKLVLDQALNCYGDECDVDTLRSFEVEPGLYYEYIRPPCVQRAFYSDAIMVKNGPMETNYMCADPTVEVASTTCCSSQTDNNSSRSEIYSGERVTFQTASQRCSIENSQICSSPALQDCSSGGGCDPNVYYWTSQPCYLQVKIDLTTGNVALVHDAQVPWSDVSNMVQENSIMFFRVDWHTPIDSFLADYNNQCTALGCQEASDGLCICDVTVKDTQVFSASSPPTVDSVLTKLSIGAFPQDGDGTLVSPGVLMYSGSSGYDMDTVFEVTDSNGVVQWRKNIESTVTVGNNGPQFRNPTHFISLVDPEVRDAHFETDATIDHYFYHQNTAPFLAVRLAQRFGNSNPSPRYVAAIADAFRTGKYLYAKSGSATTFGQGAYGDLGAAVAAVLLDRESRSIVLEADPMSGSIHEPFLKIIRLMRSLEYTPELGSPLVEIDSDLQDAIGEEPHMLPSVFSFFNPGYQPGGPVEEAGLTSPEAQVLNGPTAINLVNALLSLIKYGLNSCYGGIGVRQDNSTTGDCVKGQTVGSNGYLTYSPDRSFSSAQVVDQVAILLTSGRLSQDRRAVLQTAFELTRRSANWTQAVIDAVQLVVLSPEFHSSGLVRQTNSIRPIPQDPAPSSKPYKAVVYFALNGGCDTYNLLVPHQCTGKNSAGQTVRQQYDQERGVVAFLDSERNVTIDASTSNQPCSSFAIHDELTLLKELYDDGDLIFFANTGLIDESGLTKTNYEIKTPSELFAHNAMQDEARKVDPFSEVPGTGVLGRAADVLTTNGYSVNGLSIDILSDAVSSQPGTKTPAPVVVSRKGVKGLAPRPKSEQDFSTTQNLMNLNKATTPQSSVFAETWTDQLLTGFFQSTSLKNALDGANLTSSWGTSVPADDLQTKTQQTFETIAKLIKSHDSRGTDRDLFFASDDGYDTHSQMKSIIRPKFRAVNYGLTLFVNELKAQGLWDDVTIVVTSEFARTITPNSGLGTDHAWGGHYFMMGGSVNGGKILGEYPDDISDDGPLNIGRGRIIPTTSWDAIWNGVVEWLGVPSTQLDQCLPNRLNTVEDGFKLFAATDLFTTTSTRRQLRRRSVDLN